MKKSNFLANLLFVVASLFIFNCNAAAHNILTGDIKPTVYFKKSMDNTIVAYVENPTQKKGYVFILQTNNNVEIENDLVISDCSIEYYKTYVTFKSKDRRTTLVFKLSNFEQKYDDAKVIEGFGLVLDYNSTLSEILSKSIKNNDIVFPPVLAFSCTCIKSITAAKCDSGGPGSTGCSTTSGYQVASSGATTGCSVSCGDGWYSCCVD